MGKGGNMVEERVAVWVRRVVVEDKKMGWFGHKTVVLMFWKT